MIPLQAKYKLPLIDDDASESRMSFLRPRAKPKKASPNSDRFGEDGRRLYSAYDPAKAAKFAKAIEAAHAVEPAKEEADPPRQAAAPVIAYRWCLTGRCFGPFDVLDKRGLNPAPRATGGARTCEALPRVLAGLPGPRVQQAARLPRRRD